jgi:hypothetical protein
MALCGVLEILISMASQMNPGALLELQFHGIHCCLISDKALNIRVFGDAENFVNFQLYAFEGVTSVGISVCNSNNRQFGGSAG